MQNLERTQKALALFQQRVLGAPPEPPPESERLLAMTIRGLASFSFLLRVIPSATELDIAAILTHTLRQDPSAPTSQPADLGKNTGQSTGSTFDFTMGDDGGPECCGGVIDCEGLIE
jgi:hypothetical protein